MPPAVAASQRQSRHGRVVAEMSAGTEKDIDRAVAAARGFRPARGRGSRRAQRMEVLYRFAD